MSFCGPFIGFKHFSARLGLRSDRHLYSIHSWLSSVPGQIYIDSLPHLCASSASSSSSSSKLTALRLVRTLLDRLSSTGAPSRLTLLLPDTSPLLRDLTRTNFSSTLTCLRLHAPTVLNRLAEEHLTKPPEDGDLAKPGNRTWSLLQRVEETWDDLADEGSTDWAVGGGGGGGGALVELTVRKAHGGSTKGMTRSLEALLMAEDRRSASVGRRNRVVGRRWQDMPGLGLSLVKDTSSAEVAMGQTDAAAGGAQATSAPVQQKQGDASMAAAASQPHPSQADTSFNLGLTAQQLASRASVPIPYVFDGSTRSASTAATGGGGAPVIHFEPGSEDDVDEDDPDEDLDF